jgi:hypothetical protein
MLRNFSLYLPFRAFIRHSKSAEIALGFFNKIINLFCTKCTDTNIFVQNKIKTVQLKIKSEA